MQNAGGSTGNLASLAAVLLAMLGCGGGGERGEARPTPFPTGSPVAPTPQGTPVRATPTPVPTATRPAGAFTIAGDLAPGSAPSVAWGDGRYLVTFSQIDARPERDLFGLRLAGNGATVDDAPFLLSDLGAEPFLNDPATASYVGAAIASDREGFGVFFFGSGISVGFREVVGFASVPTSGAPVLPATEIATELTGTTVQSFIDAPSAAATDGASFVALYQHGVSFYGPIRDVRAAFVTVTAGAVEPQGTAQLSRGFDASQLTDTKAAGVASNGTETFAAWIERSARVDDIENVSTYVQGALITPTEATQVRLSDATFHSGLTQIATDGDDFLVVWNAATPDDQETPTEIRAIRYRPRGGAGGAASIEPAGGFVVADGPAPKTLSGVAFAGGTYLVTWLEEDVLRGARVGTDVDTATPFTIESGPVSSAALASDGERFLVVFERPGATTSDLLGSFIAPSD